MEYLELQDENVEFNISTNTDSNLITFEMDRESSLGYQHHVLINLDTKDIDKVIEFLKQNR